MHVGVNVAVIVLFLQIMGFIILAYAFFEMYKNRKEQISVTLDQISYTDDQLLSSEESIINFLEEKEIQLGNYMNVRKIRL